MQVRSKRSLSTLINYTRYVRTQPHEQKKIFKIGPPHSFQLIKDVEQWAEEKQINLPSKLIVEQFSNLQPLSPTSINTENKFLGLRIKCKYIKS